MKLKQEKRTTVRGRSKKNVRYERYSWHKSSFVLRSPLRANGLAVPTRCKTSGTHVVQSVQWRRPCPRGNARTLQIIKQVDDSSAVIVARTLLATA